MFFKKEQTNKQYETITNHINGLNTAIESIRRLVANLERYLSNRREYDQIYFSMQLGGNGNVDTEESRENINFIRELETAFGNSPFYAAPEVLRDAYINRYLAGLRANEERVAILEKIKVGDAISSDDLELLKRIPNMAAIDKEIEITISDPSNEASSSEASSSM